MNQQQLQNARAAHWHQTAASTADGVTTSAALLTLHDAAPWLEEIGICLFLPRHAQLPAPAPSFVEATLGGPGMTPPTAAIETAMELTSRLVAEGKIVPLNLLGNYTEQPDFLITPEVLPWVTAVRGDRQWKTPPGGRTAPIVLRTWEVLERGGGRTAAEIREELGRELTEAAVQRALIELWTTMRAVPAYDPGKPTRWSLLKDRYARELATGGNTAQATALSALISLYLQQAVAATAEETEIFLSPLTARSRIREVVHGMQATRSFGTTTVGSQTMLFVEGSLPEFAPEPEETKEPAAGTQDRGAFGSARPMREGREFRGRGKSAERPEPRGQQGRKERRESRPAEGRAPGVGQPGRPRGERPSFQADAGKREWQPRDRQFPPRSDSGAPAARDDFGKPRQGGEARPWQKKQGQKFSGRPRNEGRDERPARAEGREGREQRPWQKKGPQREFGRPFAGQRRNERPTGPQRRERPAGEPPDRPRQGRPTGERGAAARPDRPFRERREFAGKRPFGTAKTVSGRPSTGRPSTGRPGTGRPITGRPSAGRPGTGRPGTGRSGAPRGETARPGGGRPSGDAQGKRRFGGPPRGDERKRFDRPSPSGSGAGRTPRPAPKKFGKSGERSERSPRKPRSPGEEEGSK